MFYIWKQLQLLDFSVVPGFNAYLFKYRSCLWHWGPVLSQRPCPVSLGLRGSSQEAPQNMMLRSNSSTSIWLNSILYKLDCVHVVHSTYWPCCSPSVPCIAFVCLCVFSAFPEVINNQPIGQKFAPQKAKPSHLSIPQFSGCLNSVKIFRYEQPQICGVGGDPLNESCFAHRWKPA